MNQRKQIVTWGNVWYPETRAKRADFFEATNGVHLLGRAGLKGLGTICVIGDGRDPEVYLIAQSLVPVPGDDVKTRLLGPYTGPAVEYIRLRNEYPGNYPLLAGTEPHEYPGDAPPPDETLVELARSKFEDPTMVVYGPREPGYGFMELITFEY